VVALRWVLDADGTPGLEDAVEDPPDVHVEAVVGTDSEEVVLLDREFGVLSSAPATEAFEAVAEAEPAPTTVVLDGELDQRLLDVAAQRGVEQIVPRSTGEFVKQPTGVRIRTADQF
jgi:hypothetical protein